MPFNCQKILTVGLLLAVAVCSSAVCPSSQAGYPHWRSSYYPRAFMGHHPLPYRSHFYGSYYRSSYSRYGWGSYPLRFSAWRARPIHLVAPVVYVAPTYGWSNWSVPVYPPALLVAPLNCDPWLNQTPWINAPVFDFYGNATTAGDDVQLVAQEHAPNLLPAQFVGTTVGQTTETTISNSAEIIPDSLLAAADAIFRAGGYRQAAVAYAQLNVRYGSNDTIFARRFVAQVACGDLDQAAVVLASAQGAGFDARGWQAQHSNWNQLFADQPNLVEQLSERLAEHTLSGADEREGVEMMATWLNLTGQPQRAELFLAMAERLTAQSTLSLASTPLQPASLSSSPSTEAEELPAPRSKPSLVSLE